MATDAKACYVAMHAPGGLLGPRLHATATTKYMGHDLCLDKSVTRWKILGHVVHVRYPVRLSSKLECYWRVDTEVLPPRTLE